MGVHGATWALPLAKRLEDTLVTEGRADTPAAARRADTSVIAGAYKVGESLGLGGMGAVYSATQLSLRREVAIKLPHADAAIDESTTLFFNEAKRAGRVQHPNVVSIFDWGIDEDRGIPYIVMQRVVGRTLRRVLNEEGPLAVSRALRLAAHVARAIAACHETALVHRDIKPDNIIISKANDGTERVTLIDFGVARELDAVDRSPDQSLEGTIAYMSPEQAAGRCIDARSDLFALGCVLREMLTGATPYTPRENILRLSAPTQAYPPPALQLPAGQPVSVALRRLDAALLHQDLHQRPPSAEVVLEALQALRLDYQGRGVSQPAAVSAPGRPAVYV